MENCIGKIVPDHYSTGKRLALKVDTDTEKCVFMENSYMPIESFT